MFFAYLRRELINRKKQSVIIAMGMALAIALVIIVNGVSAGVKGAQASALESVYGVGTDITVTQTASAGSGGPQRFDFGSDDASSDGSSDSSGSSDTTDLAQSTLSTAMGTATYSASALSTVQAIDGVSDATATLSLQNSSFSGSIGAAPSSGSAPSGSSGSSSSGSSSSDSSSASGSDSGSSGIGDSQFSVDSFTVTGISTGQTSVGPMSSTTLESGRYLKSGDNGTDAVVLDSTYATGADLAVGDTTEIGGTTFTVVGIVSSTSSDSATASDSYIPLDTAQELSGLTGKISDISVSAESASDVSTVKAAIEKALPKTTVSTQADLASSISGSLSTVSNLVSNLGTWLSLIVLAAAFAIAILFTISGVSRRTREFGTLKAIGWSNGRIIRQVGGESIVNGIIGGIVGAAVGIAGILVVNVIAPTLSTASTSTATSGPGGAGPSSATSAAADVALQIPLTAGIILIAAGLAVLGGLLAGMFGGWRASRLRPAAALRSVA